MRAWLLLLLAACSQGVAERRESIIGGSRDTGDAAVVMLVSYPSDQSTYYTCTASVIAPSLLLTAAHCVDAANHPGYGFGAFAGDDASSYNTLAALLPLLTTATAVHPHPQYNPAPPFEADIALVELSAPLAATPLPIARSLPPSLVGQPARLVGYGEIHYPDNNAAKYQTVTTVNALPGDDTVVVGDDTHHTCVGDSGGPALVTLNGVETVIGADSYTDTTGCTEASHYRRTDRYTAFIDPYLPPPPPDLAGPADLASSSSVDMGSSPIDLSSPADLASSPDLAQAAMSGGCQEAPGAVSRWPALFIALTLLGCARWSCYRWRRRQTPRR